MARAARLSGQTFEREEDEAVADDSLSSRVKRFLMDRVLNRLVRTVSRSLHSVRGRFVYTLTSPCSSQGFWGILLFASVPNPLFDLAGITCGHLLIPFGQFFTATFIGKALVKAHLQAIVVIAVFGKEHLTGVINFIERVLPFLQGKLHKMLDAERSKLHRKFHGGAADAPAPVRSNSPTLPNRGIRILRRCRRVRGCVRANVRSQKSMLGTVWNGVLFVMISYFLASLINSSVQHHLQKQEDMEEARYLLTVGKRPVSPGLKKSR